MGVRWALEFEGPRAAILEIGGRARGFKHTILEIAHSPEISLQEMSRMTNHRPSTMLTACLCGSIHAPKSEIPISRPACHVKLAGSSESGKREFDPFRVEVTVWNLEIGNLARIRAKSGRGNLESWNLHISSLQFPISTTAPSMGTPKNELCGVIQFIRSVCIVCSDPVHTFGNHRSPSKTF